MASKDVKHRSRLKRSQLIALALPVISVIGVLSIGIVGSIQIEARFYIGCVLFIAIIVFYSEKAIVDHMQSNANKKLALITKYCQIFMSGERSIRIECPEGDNTKELVDVINQLLEQYKTHLEQNYTVQQEELHGVYRQLNQLASEIKPVLDGDLRVKSTLQTGSLGAVAEVCNGLIEDLGRLIHWTQYMASQVLQITHSHQSRIGEWAQMTETLKSSLATMTETIERLVAFALRLDSALQAGIDNGEEILLSIQHEKADSTHASTILDEAAFLNHLTVDTQEQIKLLTEIASSAQDIAEIAEPLLGELYTFARQFDQSCSLVVKAAEGSSSLAMLADNWSQAAQAFSVPEDDQQDSEDEDARLYYSTVSHLEASTQQ